jgi:hypothetical protein
MSYIGKKEPFQSDFYLSQKYKSGYFRSLKPGFCGGAGGFLVIVNICVTCCSFCIWNVIMVAWFHKSVYLSNKI